MATETRVGRFLNNLRNSLKDHKGGVIGRRPAAEDTPLTRTDTSPASSSEAAPATVRFSWRVAKAFVQLRTQPAESFVLAGLPFARWPKVKIPTLGASPTSCRVQEMFKVALPDSTKLFVKIVPVSTWNHQWQQENQWYGEFTSDGENFVMEAAALAFLHEYAPELAPKLIAILEISGRSRTASPASIRRTDETVTHIAMILELYGEDLLDYLDRRDRKNRPLDDEEKQALQIGCVLLMRRLHELGLAHLDFTPENILVGSEGLRLCDFAKATPVVTERLRHVGPVDGVLYPFESCEPTIGKGAYMPPECWSIYWRLENQRILRPLEDLAPLRGAAERVAYYFDVAAADTYMLGVVLFWIWSEGGIWKCSDPKQDEKYYYLVRRDMNLDLFPECRPWPVALKSVLKQTLTPQPWRRFTLDDILDSDWVATFTNSRNYLAKYVARSERSLR